MNSPIVSVVVTTYNHEKYIERCLDSILEQDTTFPFEVIIGEDDSNDGTRGICMKYAEKYPEKIRLYLRYRKDVIFIDGKPTGRYNFMESVKSARGKYIAICEGDDYWDDSLKLQKQIDFLEENPEYVICYHDANIIDQERRLIKTSKLPDDAKRNFSAIELKTGVFILTLTCCFRNSIKSFPEQFKEASNGDTFLFSLLGQYGKGKYLNFVQNAVYRYHDSGIWSSMNSQEKLLKSRLTYKKMLEYYKTTTDFDTIDILKNRISSITAIIVLNNDNKTRRKIFGEFLRAKKITPIFWYYLGHLSKTMFNKGYFFEKKFRDSLN